MARGRPARATVYRRLDQAIAELNDRLGGLPTPQESDSIWSDIWHLEAHHSTALEGNTLVLREVEQLLDRGRTVGAKPLKEYLEVRGYGNAARWVYSQAVEPAAEHPALVSIQEIRNIHHEMMSPVWVVAPHEEATTAESPGSFREHDIRPFGSGMTPPTRPLVPSMLTEWVDSTARAEPHLRGLVASDEPIPEILARLHHAFECVHPFIDGNGRTGRLVLNLILVRLGHPPVIIFKQDRPKYLAAMQRSDNGDHGPLGEMLARAMYDNLNRFIVPNVAGPARIVPLAALVTSDLSLAALRQAAQRGRLDAHLGSDGMWRSSAKAVASYKKSRGIRRPGGPRTDHPLK